MADAEIQRVYIKADNTGAIHCNACGGVKVVTFDKALRQKTLLKVRCQCSAVFTVRIEQRKFYRKETSLNGVFQKEFGAGFSSAVLDREKTNCRVVNLSMQGAGFTVFGRHTLQVGDPIRLGFTLDNQQRTWVEKEGGVRMIQENYIGMEFATPASSHKDLGFYLLP
jgi:hypothetical protein